MTKLDEKARRYLVEGRLKVEYQTTDSGVYKVTGSSVYTVSFHHGVWQCDCPARQDQCTHIIAAHLISPLRASKRTQLGAPGEFMGEDGAVVESLSAGDIAYFETTIVDRYDDGFEIWTTGSSE